MTVIAPIGAGRIVMPGMAIESAGTTTKYRIWSKDCGA